MQAVKATLALRRWLPLLNVDIPLWVSRLIPLQWRGYGKSDLLRIAALRGIERWRDVKLPQVSLVASECISIPLSVTDALALEEFRHNIHITSVNAAFRTAAMLGLNLPEVEIGVISATRHHVFSAVELERLVSYVREEVCERSKSSSPMPG